MSTATHCNTLQHTATHQELGGFEGYVNSVGFREDGLLLAACDHLGCVNVWTRENEAGVVDGAPSLCLLVFSFTS